MATFGAKLEHLLSSRAEIISRMHRPPPAEGNDLERLLGLPPNTTGPTSSAPPPNVPIWSDELSAAFCAVTPPIETFMDVPDEIRREQFFTTARRDDILVGIVGVIQDSGLVVTILAYDQGPRRDFDGLKLTGFCPLRQLPRYNAHGNALDAFQIGDKVRVFILDVHVTGRLILSMNSKMLGRDLYGDLKLGLITDDDLPLHYKKLQNLDGKTYEAYLESTPQFRNPDGLQVLCARMGIPRSSACSLLNCINKIRLPKNEMACELRRSQLLAFSMKHVAQGVKYFKEGRNNEAQQCYNFAIEVEPTNPDAYVARGALYASVGTYTKAVDDLEKSLELQANHANAKNYLGQTLLAYAGELNRKDPTKASQLLQRALKLDPDNIEAREALKELPVLPESSASEKHSRSGLHAWSKSPSPARSARGGGGGGGGGRRDRTPLSPPRSGTGYVSHMERSRAALEQLVEEDRSRRAVKDPGRRSPDQSPLGFYSPGRHEDRRRNTADYSRDDLKHGSGGGNMHKGDGDRGDLSKIVITRNRSGRIIRCKDDDDSMDSVGDSRRRDENWKRGHDDEGSKRSHDADIEYRNTRRVFTPPRNAREGEYGSLTAHQNDNDLPMNYRSLQERVQARLRAIERRHLQDEGIEPPPVPEAVGGGGGMMKGGREGSYPNPLDDRGESPRGGGGNFQGHWRGGGGPMHFERRGGGGFNRPDYYNRGGGPGGYYGRGRGMRGGPRWRGQWDDFRGRRGNWHPRFEDRERRRDVGGGMSGGFDRRRRRRVSDDRSSRSRSRSDRSRSRSRSYSRSASSASQSPVRPGAKGRVISRARIKTPPLAPLTNVKRSASDENLAELDNFVAQLRAKRQMEQEMQQQQQYLNQMQGEQSLPPAYPGPQVIPPVSASSVTADVERGEYDDQWDSQQPRIIGPVKPMRNVQQINSTADEEDEDIAEPASPPMRDREMDDEAAIPEAASPDSANASSPAMEQSVEA